MRILFTALAVGFAGCFITGCATQRHTPAAILQATWQQSESVSVELGVRDKSDALASFMAVFEVTGPDGSVHTARARIRDGDFSYVSFPSDFDTYIIAGRYTWRCLVESNSIASGAFEYSIGRQQQVHILD
jgi:hypothetical protein